MALPDSRRPIYLLTLLTLLSTLLFGARAHADNVSCISNGNGTDTCEIDYPDVLHASVTYAGIPLAAGDVITTLTASGCAQTGGSGSTWKRYLDPSGANSDHLYHGLVTLPGESPTRIQDLKPPLTINAAGSLVLGYEDDNYSDNGYWSHDDGTDGQCNDQTLTNHGRAAVLLTIARAATPPAPGGTSYGQCSTDATGIVSCHIDRPDVTHQTESYGAVQFRPGDQVMVNAAGCVQTGGSGSTWKRYVDPSGDNSDHLYHGLIAIPGATNGLVRISSIIGQTLTVKSAGTLELGYEDDGYDDNGYWNHDDGTQNQCQNVGPASLDITITPAGTATGDHVTLDGIEIVQSVQDLNQSVPLVAGKSTWARVYLSGTLANPAPVQGILTATAGTAAPVNLTPDASLILTADGLNARRTRWTGSLNFKLPDNLIQSGTLTLQLTSVSTALQAGVACNSCSIQQTVSFTSSPDLRVKIFSVSYTGTTSTGTTATVTPSAADVNLLESWLRRAYPAANVIVSTQSITSTIKPPFNDNTCHAVDSQLSALRAHDVSSGAVDRRTHYYGMVGDSGGALGIAFMRGCSSDVPDHPDPSVTASGPAGNPANIPTAVGDNDASYGDWYGGHELGHTFGRKHPGFCGESKDDPAYPFQRGFISDIQGTFVGLDEGDVTLTTSGIPITTSQPANPLPLTVLPGTTTTETMTYCPQPEWPSSYTFSGIRERLIEEDQQTKAAIPRAPVGSRAILAPNAVHVVGTLDATILIGKIDYIFPVADSEPQRQDLTGNAELRALDAQGTLLSTTPVAIHHLTDQPEGSDDLGTVDGSVPLDSRIASIQLVVDNQVLDQFTASARKPSTPSGPSWVNIIDIDPTNPKHLKTVGSELHWHASNGGTDSIFYSVELLDNTGWQTIGVGLTQPTITLTPAQGLTATLSGLRVVATNGFVNSDPLVLPSTSTH